MTRTTTNYAAIATASPVNRQAALMRDGGGEHHAPTGLATGLEHWIAPPLAERNPPRDLPRLEGRTFGEGMRVVRYHGKRWNGGRWLVRCACGDYELRSTQAILSAPADHRCNLCSYTRGLERRRLAADTPTVKPITFKVKWTEAELRLALALAEGRLHDASPDDRAALAVRIRERLSGVDQNGTA